MYVHGASEFRLVVPASFDAANDKARKKGLNRIGDCEQWNRCEGIKRICAQA